MFEQTFKNIDDVLWKETGCATELDYTEQTSWILFLKYLDDLEKSQRAGRACQASTKTVHRHTKQRWSVWAASKKKSGSFDHDKALTGDDLIEYVDDEPFPTEGLSHPRLRSAAAVAEINLAGATHQVTSLAPWGRGYPCGGACKAEQCSGGRG